MKRYFLKGLACLLFILLPTFSLLADDPAGPPDPGGAPDRPPVGAAPIEGGMGIMLVLAAAYGGWKLYKIRKKSISEVCLE